MYLMNILLKMLYEINWIQLMLIQSTHHLIAESNNILVELDTEISMLIFYT